MFKLLNEDEQIKYIRENTNFSNTILNILVQSPSWKIRNEIANLDNLPQEIINTLSNDSNYIVIETLLKKYKKNLPKP